MRLDPLSASERSARMARIRSKNSKPEQTVRSLIHGMGYRFRLHRKDLPATPDIVFPGRRCVIFVHGCFWHQHQCRNGRRPKSNLEYWEGKLIKNVERDRTATRKLEENGWRVLIIWECEVKCEDKMRDRIRDFLELGES
ncbi:MAG: DNA mismatch endonuclease Vsr [Paracoccaceae bacterium]|nr:DNA mismatch endonuclease Vsr [Paracoccaceae bacterium]